MRQVRRIVVVGGGSSGWMTAAYLDAALNRGERLVDIALVESPDVPRIGVGEATIPNISHILAVVGIDSIEFMKRVDGTFKQSIRYVDWLRGNGDYYYHPFSRYRPSPIDWTGRDWLMSDRSIPFTETVSAQPIICELGLAPRMLGEWDFGTPLTFAYHMNALKFADMLRDLATARGVSHYLDKVAGVETTGSGAIAAVSTASGTRLEADLFVDCTGFAALLIGETLGVDWVDCSQWLLCDRAVTMAVPYERHFPGYVRPYTTATALSNGWVWEIPLQDRRSLGYVHSSDFIAEEDAERELRAFEGAHAEAIDSRIVRFRVGHRTRSWVQNCVAVGLAGSFIEPLESTGLYLSNLAAVILTEHFPWHGDMQPMAYRFNRILANRFYEILDFINMHYCLTRRTDTEFWREVRKPERINDRLRAKLEFWRMKPPSPSDFEDQFLPGQSTAAVTNGGLPGDDRCPVDTAGLWGYESYEAILYGMDFLLEECDAWFGPDRPKPRVLRRVLNKIQQAPSKLPPHHLWLQRALGMPAYPSARAPGAF